MKFRKKPVVVEAVQYAGINDCGDFLLEDDEDLPDWIEVALRKNQIFIHSWKHAINTLEGVLFISPSDYVIRGIHGELYPCKPDIFNQTYEKVEE